MSAVVVWLDHEHAKIYEISDDRMERHELKNPRVDHHTHAMDRLDEERRAHVFFEQITQKLRSAVRILLLGPGDAKTKLAGYLAERHSNLSRKVAGCETVDHPTDRQIAAHALRLFKSNAPKPTDAA